ncbi:MAG: SDR family oxidoreductase [Pseudomonas sp.]|uniref:UDP-glucose 4-epimerase family protein n=1 Tax=Pseudomonas sp. TaxID=306 RepID=UPI002736739C|nr:SDR family oxidoreductase [Pseudomonas sp.]MDP3846181.1 SDR family oxidoreductase [Pseudomonas sp.]
MRLLLTGSSGFIGQALRQSLGVNVNYNLRCAYRFRSGNDVFPLHGVAVGDIDEFTDWSALLADVEVVLHTAAIAHIQGAVTKQLQSDFDAVNTQATLALARQSAAAGVKRFIFLSTVKVLGENTSNSAFTADSKPVPIDAYACSKWRAEQGLRALVAETSMEIVIIRPVLVYGPGVKANFRSMMSWLSKGVPLPLGAIGNKRSLVALDNLVDLIVTCIDHPAAANQTFLVSDGEDLSTSELLEKMAMALGKTSRLLPVPSWMLEGGARLLGKQALAQRVCGSLQVDISKTRELLNWSPPVSVDQALRKTAEYFLQQRRS